MTPAAQAPTISVADHAERVTAGGDTVRALRTFWVAVLVVGIAASVGIIARGAALVDGPTGATDPSVLQADDPAALRALAERALAPAFGPPGMARPMAKLFPGTVAKEAGFDMPVPAGGRIVGSVLRTGDARLGGTSVDVIADVPGTPLAAMSFYEKQLELRGLTPPAGMQQQPPRGFVASPPNAYLTLCNGTTGWVSVNISVLTAELADVRVHVDASNPGPCGGGAKGGPMSGKLPPGYELLPALYPPDGIVLTQIGAPGGLDRFGSEATTNGTGSAAALEDGFAAQLAKAGWTRTGGAHDNGLAWSHWSVANASWSGLLFVTERPGGRDLSVRIVKN